MSLEELAELTGVPPRTIRFYQTKKLLQRPEKDAKDARVSRYGPEHAERLRLIGELHDRGLKLPAIRNLLEEGDASTRISDWLGLDDSLRGSWNSEGPRLIEREELSKLLAPTPPGTQGFFEDAGLIVRQGKAWLVPNPSLLDLTIGLVADGVRTDLVLEAGNILQQHLGKAADQLIDLFVKALGEGFGAGVETNTLVEALRPAAGDAARMIFGLQLERAIEALLADTRRLSKH
jgi:DNA-binding transcriptional MerR regulator